MPFKLNWFVALNTPEGDRNYSGAVDFDNLLYIQKVIELLSDQMLQQVANSYGPVPTSQVTEVDTNEYELVTEEALKDEDEPTMRPEVVTEPKVELPVTSKIVRKK